VRCGQYTGAGMPIQARDQRSDVALLAPEPVFCALIRPMRPEFVEGRPGMRARGGH
jgi:hypothetical protein